MRKRTPFVRAILVFLAMVVPVLPLTGCRKYACDDQSARLVAHAYVLSNPLLGQENELIPLMQYNMTYFLPEGKAIQCMQSLGTGLVQKGMALSNQFSGNLASNRFGGRMPAGLQNLPGQVDQNLRSFGANQVIMGKELIWLSQVLPAALLGNPTLYQTTGTDFRQMQRLQLRMYLTLCQMAPALCQDMQAFARSSLADLEQQIYILARQ